jgi:hypothetical protein
MTTTIMTRDSKVVELRDDGTWRYVVPDRSALARLRTLPILPAIAAAVQGMFSQLGVKVIDSGEAFTCRQHGDRVEIVVGVEEASVDFVVHVYQFQLERLAGCISRGALDELHGTPLRILRVPLADAMALQRNFHGGLKAGLTPAKWIRIARWYVDWRKRVDVTPR